MGHTTQLHELLGELSQGSSQAQEDLIAHACQRLRLLARKMLGDYPRVRRWAETDDVLQGALVRLHRALCEVKPETPAQFFGLAATQIRRELIDLVRQYYGVNGWGKRHQTGGAEVVATTPDCKSGPASPDAWVAFHQSVEALPEKQKQVVNLLWYEGLTQREAAEVLGVSLSTLKRRWQAARLTLCAKLRDAQLE